MSNPIVRAAVACTFFSALGAAGWFFTEPDFSALPLAIYYAVIVVNTFFSIRVFATITPKSAVQALFDVGLVFAYALLAFSFGSVLLFTFVSGVLFLIAIGKYVHLDHLITLHAFVRRKIFINKLGTLLSFTTFGMTVFGFEALAAWTLGGTFGLANVYLLAIKPMYRLDSLRD